MLKELPMTVKFNSGNPAVYHYASGDLVPIAALHLYTEHYVQTLRSQIEKLQLELGRLRENHVREARTLAAAREAEVARLREALTQVRDAMLATGQGPDGDDDPRRPLATAVWSALASTPAPGPTEREMRVAEALRVVLTAVLDGLKLDEWMTYEGNLDAHGYASVDALNAARAALELLRAIAAKAVES